jgi:predicted amidophosphoribosyltransferase
MQTQTQNLSKVNYTILKTTHYCQNCGRSISNNEPYCADCI